MGAGMSQISGEANTPVAVKGQRLREANHRKSAWRRCGPYLSERQWGTVREDYSPCLNYRPEREYAGVDVSNAVKRACDNSHR